MANASSANVFNFQNQSELSIAKSALAHKTGLKIDPLNNCLLPDKLKDCWSVWK